MRHQPNVFRDWLDAPCPVLWLQGSGPRRTPGVGLRRGPCSRLSSRLPLFRFRAGNVVRDRARLLRCLRYLDPRLVLAPDRVTWRTFRNLLKCRNAGLVAPGLDRPWLAGPLVTEWLFVPALDRLVQVIRPTADPNPRRPRRRRTLAGRVPPRDPRAATQDA